MAEGFALPIILANRFRKSCRPAAEHTDPLYLRPYPIVPPTTFYGTLSAVIRVDNVTHTSLCLSVSHIEK